MGGSGLQRLPHSRMEGEKVLKGKKGEEE